jgi:nitrite reductase (NADH) large subunit
MRYVIIGNGVAANSAAEAIRQRDGDGSIVMLSRSRHNYYYVPALPEYLAGEKTISSFTLHDDAWYEKHDIEQHLAIEVTRIDSHEKAVVTATGERFAYDRLLLATGGRSFVPPIPGADLDGVLTLRTIDDADRILARMGSARRLVVIGGGLLGIEAGNGLRKRGIEVEVIETFPRLLPRQTDPAAAELLKKQLEEMGFRFILGAKPVEIFTGAAGLAVRLEDGREIPSGSGVLISAGVRPEAALATALGLEMGLAVKVNDRMETGHGDIYAAGDLVEHRGRYYGIWPAATAQGRVAGLNMAGGSAEYGGSVPSNRLKVAGVDLLAAGELDPEGSRDALLSTAGGHYRKLVLDTDVIIGAVLLGDIRGADYIQYAIQKKVDVSRFREQLLDAHFDFSRLKTG